jgi:hypothetical protein
MQPLSRNPTTLTALQTRLEDPVYFSDVRLSAIIAMDEAEEAFVLSR